jgi:TIR domain
MKVFLSYPSAQRPLAERLALALEAEGHDVFFDRADLDAGEAFHQRLREGVEAADALIFLVTPESVAPGSYTLAELEIARQRWRRPSGHVLPVMVVPTPMAQLPPYLTAVTVLQPRGEPVAETVAALARLGPERSTKGRRYGVAAVLALLLLAVAGYGVSRHLQARADEQARLADGQRQVAMATGARELCDSGNHALALDQLSALAARSGVPAQVLDLREDCAMRWLRNMRATSGAAGPSTFNEQVAKAVPVLLEGLARSQGTRAADLRAHVGWGEFLRGLEGTQGLNPQLHWKRALEDDAENPYAHAMWARQLLERGSGLEQAKGRFARALASGRNRTFVRSLQIGSTLGSRDELHPYALAVLDEMRRAKEPLETATRDRVNRYAFGTRMLDADYRRAVLAALPPDELLATFRWLFPGTALSDDRRPVWRYNIAVLQAHAGDTAAARAGLQSLVNELRATDRPGRLLDEAQKALAGLP